MLYIVHLIYTYTLHIFICVCDLHTKHHNVYLDIMQAILDALSNLKTVSRVQVNMNNNVQILPHIIE